MLCMSLWRLCLGGDSPPKLCLFVCSIHLFVHLPILLSDPALAVRVVSAYSAGEIGEASKVM